MTDLQARLVASQAAVEAALDAADWESLPALVAAREVDVRDLVAGLASPELAAWARDWLERDRAIEARLVAAREAVRTELTGLQLRKAAGRAYISGGSRG